VNLGTALSGQDKLAEAEAEYRKGIELDRQSPAAAYRNLGLVLSRQNKQGEAIAAHRRAVELDPGNAPAHNDLAWALATCPEAKLRDPQRAVALARKAVELQPEAGFMWNTLGVARYRAGDWKAAAAALERSMELRNGGDGNDWFFLAMARWQLGEMDRAREWYGRAVQWMDKNQPNDEELRRFRAEARDLLGLNEKK
jgi:tetratricopeptide (TPR) repeat protein